jgi:signal recognition particle subunit SRP54
MFENLQERLEGAFKTLKGQGKITEINVAETVKEIRRALVDADVNYKIAKDFTDKVRETAMGQGSGADDHQDHARPAHGADGRQGG